MMIKLRLALRRLLPACLIAMALGCSLEESVLAGDKTPTGALEALAHDFWQWQARYQPFSKDDIPRIARPLEDQAGSRVSSAGSIAQQKATLAACAQQSQRID